MHTLTFISVHVCAHSRDQYSPTPSHSKDKTSRSLTYTVTEYQSHSGESLFASLRMLLSLNIKGLLSFWNIIWYFHSHEHLHNSLLLPSLSARSFLPRLAPLPPVSLHSLQPFFQLFYFDFSSFFRGTWTEAKKKRRFVHTCVRACVCVCRGSMAVIRGQGTGVPRHRWMMFFSPQASLQDYSFSFRSWQPPSN